jgi:HK97 family phage major capsid protein
VDLNPETFATEVKSDLSAVKNDQAITAASVDALRLEVKNLATASATAQPKTLVKLVEEKAELKNFKKGDRAVEFKAPVDMLRSAIGNSQTFLTAGPLVQAPDRLTHVRDFLSIGRISTPVYTYDRELAVTGGPTLVAEGARKPQTSFTYEQITANALKIAHYFKLSTETVNDAPAFAYAMQKRGVELLLNIEDYQLLYGAGGLMTVATAFSAGTLKVADAQELDVLRAAMAQIRKAQYQANAIFVSPSDAAKFELLKNSNGNYLMPSMYNGSAVASVAGVRIVGIDAINDGEYLVGAFNQAVDAFQVEDITIRVSDSNEADFVENKVTTLVEERFIIAVTRPAALVHGTFAAGITALS